MIMAATAPTTMPWIQGFVLTGIFMERVLSGSRYGGSPRLSQPSQPEELLADGDVDVLSYCAGVDSDSLTDTSTDRPRKALVMPTKLPDTGTA